MLLFHLQKHIPITLLYKNESGFLLSFIIHSRFFVLPRLSYKQLPQKTCQPCNIFYRTAYVTAVGLKSLRVSSHERRNELKPVWDFIWVENLTSVFSQLFTFVHMNWGEMKLKTVWISYWSFWPKWNFKLAWDFHANIIYPQRNE